MVVLLTSVTHAGPVLNDPRLALTTYASGIDRPVGFDFIGNDDMLVVEQFTGNVDRVHNGVVSTVAQLSNIDFGYGAEEGLLGIAVSPSFSMDHHVYLSYTSASSAGERVSMFTWNGSTLTGETPVLTLGSNGFDHNGGTLRFGPDGKLYGVVGDQEKAGAEQNTGTTPENTGGIYRLNPDGTIPADNPFAANPTTAFQKWDAYGVRNSFGLAFDPVTGKLWDTENGPTSYDEVNMVSPGFNSGWVKIMGPQSRSGVSLSTLTQLPNSAYSDPEFSWKTTIAPTGIEFLARATNDPAYEDKVIVGDTNDGRLLMLTLNAQRDGFALSGSLADLVADNSIEANSLVWGTGFSVPTDLKVGPDGGLYVASFTSGPNYVGQIYRIELPEPAGGPLALGALLLILSLRSRRRMHSH